MQTNSPGVIFEADVVEREHASVRASIFLAQSGDPTAAPRRSGLDSAVP